MEERDALSTRLQSATDTYKSEKVRRQEEITHLQKMLQEAQVHSQQQAKVNSTTLMLTKMLS